MPGKIEMGCFRFIILMAIMLVFSLQLSAAKDFFTVILIPDTQWYTWPRNQEPLSDDAIKRGKIRS